MTTQALQQPAPAKALRVALWIAQLLVALAFCNFGLMKLMQPIAEGTAEQSRIQ